MVLLLIKLQTLHICYYYIDIITAFIIIIIILVYIRIYNYLQIVGQPKNRFLMLAEMMDLTLV